MTRETKVGLLFGVAVVMLIGIIAADHLASTKSTPNSDANILEYIDRAADESRMTRRQAPPLPSPNANTTTQPLRRALPSPNTTPTRTTQPQRYQFVRAIATDSDNASSEQNATTNPPPTRRSNTSSRAASLLQRASQNNTTTQNPAPARPLTNYERSVLDDQDRVNNNQPARATRRPSLFDRTTPTTPPTTISATPRPPANRIIGTTISTTPNGSTASSPSTPITPGKRDPRIHIVKPNESLYGIALKYYGNGDKWNLIKNANPTTVSESGAVNAGAKLLIPFDPEILKQLENPATSPTTSAMASRTNPQPSNEITVKPGDTLSQLSLKYLGSSKHWEKILKHNNMKDASELRAGMKLKLPTLDNTPTPATPQTTSTTPRSTQPVTSSKTYTVKSGDSLIRIAKRELGDGSRWQEIFKLNKATLKSPDAIKVGQTLKLP